MRTPLPPADPQAVALAFRACAKVLRCSPTEAVSLYPQEKRAFREGRLVVKRDSKLAMQIVAVLIGYLEAVSGNRTRAERLNNALRAAFGERAFRNAIGPKGGWYRERGAARGTPRTRNSDAPVVSTVPSLVYAGLHVAPFLSADSGLVIAAIDGRGHLGALTECGQPMGGHSRSMGNGCAVRDADVLSHDADVVWGALRGEAKSADGRPLFGPPMLSRGVHVLPWRPWNMPAGHCVVAIDHDRRMVAMMDAADGQAAQHARRELAAILEMLSPEPYRDPYEDGHVDDDSCGEDWKRSGGAQ